MNLTASKLTDGFAYDLDTPAVSLKGVGKAFTLEGPKSGPFSLGRSKTAETFWALKNIDLEVRKGRSIGILGLNGAGKSTLLGIIAATLRPSEGSVSVDGRVQLLQLGAGFALELSARQNITSYARTRGVPKSEIDKRIAYVEEFADIGKFFDQPMKNYSSGMRGRVAFGNAFAVDPEILIVDEALAVGDAVFVNKCYRRLDEARSRGMTLFYTSHSAGSVVRLCDDGMVLHKGQIDFEGSAKSASEHYSKLLHGSYVDEIGAESEDNATAVAVPAEGEVAKAAEIAASAFQFTETDNVDRSRRCPLYSSKESIFGGGGARIVDCAVFANGRKLQDRSVNLGDRIEIFARVFFDHDVEDPNFGFILSPISGECFYGSNQEWLDETCKPARKGETRTYRLSFAINVAPGPWFVDLAIANPRPPLQKRTSMLHFVVLPTAQKSSGPGWLDLSISE